ncbi:MAG: thymidine phosphorylase [Pseudomonadales bacterium]|nr:thymidine phosphorylase [Pseudomonadales bacterium]
MLFTEVIRKKRDGQTLTKKEIQFFVDGLTNPDVPAEQISAFAMAVFLNSMTFTETGFLTSAMANSGQMLDWGELNLPGPVIDKHSTGGVGDKVSMLLAPIAAACGCYVPMISGQGLGHTGGTLDKMSAIPSYQTFPDLSLFKKVVKQVGCAIIGQTSDLAPADRRFYAIRDVTSTVESIPLITASILSKKIAAGNEALIMDVKWGNGAFMQTLSNARDLATSIMGTAAKAGVNTRVVITDMNEVLGSTAGNALEIRESIDYLANNTRETRLDEVVVALLSEMLLATGISDDLHNAHNKIEQAITSGEAYEKFSQMLVALGVAADFMEQPDKYLPKANIIVPVLAEQNGWLSKMDTRAMGNVIVELGGGRKQTNQQLDLSVGFSEVMPLGSELQTGQTIALIHAKSPEDAERATQSVQNACLIAGEKPVLHATVVERLTS